MLEETLKTAFKHFNQEADLTLYQKIQNLKLIGSELFQKTEAVSVDYSEAERVVLSSIPRGRYQTLALIDEMKREGRIWRTHLWEHLKNMQQSLMLEVVSHEEMGDDSGLNSGRDEARMSIKQSYLM